MKEKRYFLLVFAKQCLWKGYRARSFYLISIGSASGFACLLERIYGLRISVCLFEARERRYNVLYFG